MKQYSCFFRKEFLAQKRTSKLAVMLIVFVLLGVIAPATAKLMPKLFESFGGEVSGLKITVEDPTAFASFQQFFKNAAIGLIAFAAAQSGIFTKEYASGTLILALTKGMRRRAVLVSKALILALMWTVLWWLSFGITLAGTVFFWDISVVNDLLFAVFGYWLFGLMFVSLTVLFSAVSKGTAGVVGGLGGVYFGNMIAGTLPKVGDWLPIKLTAADAILNGSVSVSDCIPSAIITGTVTIAAFIAGAIMFDKRAMQ